MKPKEINQIIQEQTEAYFKEEGFKYSKKDMGYMKDVGNAKVRYGFSYVERHPQYYYKIYTYIKITEVEEIYSNIDGTGILGNTGVFPLSYFLFPNDSFYRNKNPKFLIEKEENIQEFSKALVENYSGYFKDFIPNIIQPQNMIDFLLNAIKEDEYDTHAIMRVLILLKLNSDSRFSGKYNEFKTTLKDYSEEDQKKFLLQINKIASGNF